MNKIFLSAAALAVAALATSCGHKQATLLLHNTAGYPQTPVTVNQEGGALVLFDGTSTDGWRGYGKDHLPEKWSIEEGALTYTPSNKEGGDIIFAHPFGNFVLDLDWKVDKGSNSGIFFYAQEVQGVNEKGEKFFQPIYISAPEYQVLDNENHPDAKLGVDGNRKSASLYDMIPAKPQNSKPYGEWNHARIVVKDNKVEHWQNGEKVVEYTLNTPEWTALLQASKFSEKNWPAAFALLNNCGGKNHMGYIGLQDHGDRVQYRNITVKELK